MSIETYANDLGPDRIEPTRAELDAAELSAWLREPMSEPTSAVLAWCEARCFDILPTVPTETTVPYLLALIRHAENTEETFAELLSRQLAPEGITADDITRGSLVQSALDGYLAPDTSTLAVTPAPFDPTLQRPRVKGPLGVAVKGSRHLTRVVGQLAPEGEHGPYVSMPSGEAVERADLLMRASGELIPLIGTDTFSWSEIVTFRPDRYAIVGGAWIPAPEGSGSSLTGEARKRRTHRGSVARYWHRPDTSAVVDAWCSTGDAMRIVKRYRTSLPIARVVERDAKGKALRIVTTTRHFIGTDECHDLKRTKVLVKRVAMAVASETPRADALAALESAYAERRDVSLRFKSPDGTRWHVTHAVARRMFTVSVKPAGGKTVRVSSRTLPAIRSVLAS